MIAALNGHAVAGGCMLALTCDRVATEILYTGAMYSGADALQIGLVDQVRSFRVREHQEDASRTGRGADATREEASIREMADIWYSEHTWANLKSIAIR